MILGNNIPWNNTQLKSMVGYRNWEAIKCIRESTNRQQLVDAYESGRRILFIHIPKTAGVSLINTYSEFFADARHCPVLCYKLLLGKKLRQFILFSIVRNPWARLFSAYNYLKAGGLTDTDRIIGQILDDECPTFERFVKDWLTVNGVYSYMHFVPQYEFVCGFGLNVIVDNIIKLEHLDVHWPALSECLGVPLRVIHHSNASARQVFREYYDNESVAIVGKLYSKDINLFNYKYE